MSVKVIVDLEDDDAAYLAKLAEEGGLGFGQFCASIIVLTVIDDRAAERPQDTAA